MQILQNNFLICIDTAMNLSSSSQRSMVQW